MTRTCRCGRAADNCLAGCAWRDGNAERALRNAEAEDAATARHFAEIAKDRYKAAEAARAKKTAWRE